MRRGPYAAVATVIAVVILVVMASVTGASAPKRNTAPVATAAVTAATLVCPAVNATPSTTTATAIFADVGKSLVPAAPGGGSVRVSSLIGATTTSHLVRPAPVVAIGAKSLSVNAYAAEAQGAVAATLVGDELTETAGAGRYRGLLGSSCLAPATNWWFAGADGRVGYTDALFLANPAPTPAEVGVTLWTAKGLDSPPHLDAIPVPARSRVVIYLASVAPDVPTIAMRVHAESGAVVAALSDRRTSALQSDGGDYIPPTASPDRAGLIPGFPGGAGSRKLVLADPGPVDATVSLKLVTTAGTFAPAGANQVVVHAQHTQIVDLSTVFANSTGAVEFHSDQPVVAEGLAIATVSRLRPDFMWLAAVRPLSGPAAVADGAEPDGGSCYLLLTAPAAAATVRVATPAGRHLTIAVPAGKSVATNVTSTISSGKGPWPFSVTPIATAPVYGVRVLYFAGAHGALITGEPLSSLPHPIPLPPVRDDPRAALR